MEIKTVLAGALDGLIRRLPAIENIYVPLRAQPIRFRYRKRRERYAAMCKEKQLVYREDEIISKVRERLQVRGYKPFQRKLGKIHTFAFIPRVSWHDHLYDELNLLGQVTGFDYLALGYNLAEMERADYRGLERRREMNARALSAIEKINRENPIDWVFVYASGREISPGMIQDIQERCGIPTVNMCLDDKQSWEGKWMGDYRAGQIDLASVFDLSWTSARVATGWYLAEGGLPIYLPEGCNPKVYRPMPVEHDIPVSFIGRNYGFRASAISFLHKHGIPVKTFGNGWSTGKVGQEQSVRIMCRSQINLGMGGIGYAEDLTNVKGRDFDVPVTGGGVYITSFNPHLALHFDIGREIVCYRSRDEMLELIRYYLNHQDEARQISNAGRQRCLREHRWLHRYIKVCQVLGILDDSLSPLQLAQQLEESPEIDPCATPHHRN